MNYGAHLPSFRRGDLRRGGKLQSNIANAAGFTVSPREGGEEGEEQEENGRKKKKLPQRDRAVVFPTRNVISGFPFSLLLLLFPAGNTRVTRARAHAIGTSSGRD